MTNAKTGTAPAIDVPDLGATVDETLPERIAAHARAQPEAAAVFHDGRTLTWGELGARMEALARGLRAAGCRPGERVAIVAQNSIEYVVAILAIVRAEAVVVPMPLLVSEAALGTLLNDADARVVLGSQQHQSMVERLSAALPSLLPQARIALDFSAAGWTTLGALEEAGARCPALPAVDPDAPFNIIYSSGTTGTPKGIVQSHRTRAIQSAAFGRLGCDTGTRTLISTPLYANFSFGGSLVTLWGGGALVLMRKFNEEDFLQLCREFSPTHAFVVPVQIERLLRHPHFDASVQGRPVLKYASGSPMREETKREALQRWPGPLVEVYGMTEGGAVTALIAGQHPDKLASVGRVVGGGNILIVDEEGRPLPVGQVGEIVGTAGPSMAGYNNRPEASAEMMWQGPDGRTYLRSGDLGYLDADGFLYLTGRRKDLIISGGLNIHAIDLEEVLLQHPQVAEAAVIGVPSERFGEAPLALVVMRQPTELTPQQLLHWANERLGKAQRLCGVEFRSSLPRGPIGKILKAELRRLYRLHEAARAPLNSATGADDHLAAESRNDA